MTPSTPSLRPQPGPQEAFLASSADIVIYGGAAGGGKSYALLLEPLRHINHPGFGAVTFRRTTPQIRNEGGLWDESEAIYGAIGLTPRETLLEWENPHTGVTLKFAHLEHEKDVYEWQGAQIALIAFDELTHFTSKQFWYMLSRNRSTCGVRPYVRATCNPDPDSWVADFIAWWIDQDPTSPTYGTALPERAGQVRYFARVTGTIHWADDPDELRRRFPGIDPKSATFIPSTLDDNPALTSKDPGYRANLMALDPVEQARLLGGNWKARAEAGLMFQREWVSLLGVPPQLRRVVRAWDFAASRPTQEYPDPDYTVSVKVGETLDGDYVVLDVTYMRDTPGEVERHFLTTTRRDGPEVEQRIPQDPGEAGKTLARQRVLLPGGGIRVRARRPTANKVVRFQPASARAYQRQIAVMRGSWNDWFFSHLEAFPNPRVHDDPVDAFADAIDELISHKPVIAPKQTSFSTYTIR